ncbi:MAG: hypothetical protein LQ349_000082 [Xanthoria aureola]|nr:MAG: hypothetical protein LQ349_000082 [Xanthoria aureola]
MAPRIHAPRRCRTPSSAPIFARIKTSYRVKRKPASPLPAGHVLNSPRYSPTPSPGSGRRMRGAFPRDPSKWMTKPLLPFRRVHQFRPYGVYLQFPGAGFLESRLRKKVEGELEVVRARMKALEAENEMLRRHWTIQVELQDRGHGEDYEKEGGKKAHYFDQLRLETGARDRGTVRREVWRMERLLDRALEKAEGWKTKANTWKEKTWDVRKQMDLLKAQVAALNTAEEGDENGKYRDDEEEQIARDLEAQFDRDLAVPTTMNSGRRLRSQGQRG